MLLAVALLMVSCQPVDELSTGASADGEEPTEPEVWGTEDLGDLRLATGEMAREWDADAQLARVSVRLDDDLAWVEATTTYVAPDAARLLVLTASDEGVTEEQPTLETLGFEAPPADALAELPDLAADVVPPATAAEQAMDPLDDCDLPEDPRQVIYSNGAPGSWEGTSWSSEPAWTVSVATEGGGVRLDLDGSVPEDPCYELP